MYKIRTLDDYVASGAGVPVQAFPFSYRLNTVSDGTQYLGPSKVSLCTWPITATVGNGVVGYPQVANAHAATLDTLETTAPGVGNVYQGYALSWSYYAGEGEDGVWDMSTINTRYSNAASGRDPLALLHSFTAFGSVGTVYLVDMLAVIPLSGTYSGGELRLHESDVAEMYARPLMRGSTDVQVAYSWVYGDEEDQLIMARPFYVESLGFSPLDDPAAALSQTPGESSTDPFSGAPWCGTAPTVESDEIRAWRAAGRIPALRSVTPAAGTWGFGALLVFDVIASVELPSTGVAQSTGLHRGHTARIAPDSNLGILFNSATASADPALLQGTVKILA